MHGIYSGINFWCCSGTSSDDTLIIATKSPAAIQSISWNPQQVNATQTSVLNRLGIMENEKSGTDSLAWVQQDLMFNQITPHRTSHWHSIR